MATMSTLNFLSVLPEAIVLGAACAILVLDAFLPDRLRHLSFWLTQLALLVAAWLVYATAAGELRTSKTAGFPELEASVTP